MSSAATAGPPPTRPESMNGGGPAVAILSHNGVKPGTGDNMRGTERVLPHIDDLLAVRPEISAFAPIRRLLLEGDTYAKQAETHLDFRRPEIALQEYIKAFTIAVHLIPRHKDYPALKSDRGELHRLYTGLQKRINSQHEKFEDVKNIIKENNSRNAVKPIYQSELFSSSKSTYSQTETPRPRLASSQGPTMQEQSIDLLKLDGGDDALSTSGGISSLSHDGNIKPIRQKPPVQPKPDALHGRAIKSEIPSKSNWNVPNEDLEARFARLRVAGPHSLGQDPRIQTRSLGMPDAMDLKTKPASTLFSSSGQNKGTQLRVDRPSGPRDMPKAQPGPPRPHKIPLDVEIPTLPKVPDAIYSPSRNLKNPVDDDLLQNSYLNAYSAKERSATIATVNGVIRTSANMDRKSDYSTPVNAALKKSSPRLYVDDNLPDATTVTAEELLKYLKRGSHELYILLVDIRDRAEFDGGHIMSQSIICIDPIVLRRGMSGEELGQSLVLSPETEQNLFETRDSFDLVVYYDQSSTSNKRSMSTNSDGEDVLGDFSRAVYDYGYDKCPKHRPRLLVGGLDAWVDLLGPGALAVSQTSSYPTGKLGRNTGQLTARAPIARETRRLLAKRRMAYESRPLSKEEEMKWEEAIREKEAELAELNEVSFIKTTEDFVRRFPEPSAIQESMVSPPNYFDSEMSDRNSHDKVGANHSVRHVNELHAMPQIPTRPAPALPRNSYSGIPGKTNFTAMTPGLVPPLAFKQVGEDGAKTLAPRGHTGLINKGQLCYMNSVIQALNWTDQFPNWLGDVSKNPPKIPAKKGEHALPPMHMVRNLAVILQTLNAGYEDPQDPETLRGYVSACHSASVHPVPNLLFGGKYQQDALEFLLFLLEVLEGELNLARDRTPLISLTPSQEEARRKQPIINSSRIEWDRFQHTTRSYITEKFRGQSVFTQTCKHCGFAQKSWDTWLSCSVNLERTQGIKKQSIKDLHDGLNLRFMEPEQMDDYKCEKCNELGSERIEKVSRYPEILIIMLNRAKFGATVASKIQKNIEFPLDDLCMDPYFISTDGGQTTEKLPRGFHGPFKYDCYAIIQHAGSTIDSGHYWTLARNLNQRNLWTRLDDRFVTSGSEPAKKTKSHESYLLFYRRRGQL